MGAELDLAEDESASVFSARKVRARLRADDGKPAREGHLALRTRSPHQDGDLHWRSLSA